VASLKCDQKDLAKEKTLRPLFFEIEIYILYMKYTYIMCIKYLYMYFIKIA